MTQPVPLFGEFRVGTAALAYHLVYALLFLVLAVGLWTAKPWGYHTIFIGGVLYTLDKIQFLMSGNITQEFVSMIFRGQEQLLQAVGRDMVMLSLTLVVISFVLGWWGLRITPTCGGRISKAVGKVSTIRASCWCIKINVDPYCVSYPGTSLGFSVSGLNYSAISLKGYPRCSYGVRICSSFCIGSFVYGRNKECFSCGYI